jgi:hypothetical protein
MLLLIRRLPDEIALENTYAIPTAYCYSECTSCSIGGALFPDGYLFYWNSI